MTTASRLGRASAVVLSLVLALLLSVLTGCGSSAPEPAAPVQARQAAATLNDTRVVAISLDGLNPRAITQLGPSRLPNIYRLFREGAGTLNARAQVEQTVTLPNHTSMVTGRRIDRTRGGHGVTWNTDLAGSTVQKAARHDVSSVFRVVHAAGGSTSLFSTKTKFTLFTRSWPRDIARTVIRKEDDATLTTLFRRDLLAAKRSFAFLHLGLADQTGHAKGWLSPSYLNAVVRLDRLVGGVMTTIRGTARLRRSTVVILTADHGGTPGTKGHDVATRYDNYRIPFVVWGRGVTPGNLYRLNDPRYVKDPGTTRPGFTGAQPVRNGDLANLATRVLGLGPVPGSLWNRSQRLTWHR
ncbi:alkaline phosphatase family protein [Nocardioides sp. LML1-1-1.1]|uniref:alkaline phosphatase family protein n=1 Tax=Nocardioides sp. LML1-1-1.1 TaxID=3135248 RepID=UPI0034443920